MTEMIVIAPVETAAESFCYLNKPSHISAFHMTLVGCSFDYLTII